MTAGPAERDPVCVCGNYSALEDAFTVCADCVYCRSVDLTTHPCPQTTPRGEEVTEMNRKEITTGLHTEIRDGYLHIKVGAEVSPELEGLIQPVPANSYVTQLLAALHKFNHTEIREEGGD